MGWVMVYRYRPMRVSPTMTTSCVMPSGSFMRAGTLWVVRRGVNSQFGENCVSEVEFLVIFFRGSLFCRNKIQ